MIRAVFFDAGHTLLHAAPSIGHVYQRVAREFGVEIEPPERFTELLGPIFRKHMPAGSAASNEQDFALWRTVTLEMHDRMPEFRGVNFDAWFEALHERFGRGEVWSMYDDVPPVLSELRERGLKLGIVSNWDTRLRRIVRETGVEALVDFVKISCEVGWRKPNRAIFDAALSAADVKPHEALHVGDLYPEDVVGAHGAGLRPVMIVRRDGVLDAGERVPFTTIHSLEELIPLVER